MSNASTPLFICLISVAVSHCFFQWSLQLLIFNVGVVLLATLGLTKPALKEGEFRPSPNMFMGSGKTPPSTVARELILKKKGGKGSAYFSDPSLAFGELSNFQYTVGKAIDFKQLLLEKADVIGPYCIDDENRQIVFVETEPDFDPAETGPFYFQSQRDHAVKLFVVPYEEYHRVIAELPNTHTDNLVLVYNTSRCGSTLLSKCCDSVTDMQAISEPDVFTGLTHLAAEAKGTRDEDIVALARSSGKLLCYLRRQKNPDRDAVCLKFRFQQVYINKLIQQALPDAKPIFLYRNGLDVIDSMGAAFINTGLYRAIRTIGIDTFYIWSISTLPDHLWKLMPLIRDPRFPMASFKPLGAVVPFVFTWLSVMQAAIEAKEAGTIDVMIRYEDMIKGKDAYVRKMLEAVGVKTRSSESSTKDEAKRTDSSAKASEIFNADVHQGVTRSKRTQIDQKTGKVVRSDRFAYLKPSDVSVIKNVMAYHETILCSEFIIPGTLSN